MSYEILNRWTSAVLYRSELAYGVTECIQEARRLSVDLSWANLSSAYLSSADLSSANLSSADLSSANLSSAKLRSVDLSSANLSRANLRSADLRWADLSSANLRSADLRSADLSSANLSWADLTDDTIMPDGETWKKYREEVVPALLIAGGQTMEAVCHPKHWNCHDWNNCPMAAAFGVTSEEDTPLLLRPRVREFVHYFDAHLIPNPLTGELPK